MAGPVNVACVGPIKPRQDTKQGRLSHAVGADQGQTRLVSDGEGYTLQNVMGAESFGEVLGINQGHGISRRIIHAHPIGPSGRVPACKWLDYNVDDTLEGIQNCLIGHPLTALS